MRIRPSRDEFRSLAREFTVVPVWAELLADLETPVAAYAKLVGDAPGFLLESVEHGERWSRFSFVGRDPVATLVLRDGRVDVEGALPVDVPRDRGMLAALEHLLDVYRAPVIPELPPLHGGLMGYLGYDVIREVERLPDVPPDDRHLPDAVMSMIGSLAAFDHWRQRVTLIESVPVLGDVDLDAAYDAAVASIGRAVANLARPLPYVPVEPPDADEVLPDVKSSMPDGLYQQAVEVAKEYIVAGDIFQVVLAQRYDLQLDADPFDVYRVLRQVNPSPYMYFVRHPELTIVGSSPEPMVQLLDGTVISRPIAGTRKRGSTDEHDRRLAAELIEHPKERAEHVMLVDLARNDVGRVADFGTVHVDELMTLERYSHVMHLTSQVSGRLRDGLGPVDVLRATLPAGTVSGAPKVRAMEIIDELEPVKRGPYAGRGRLRRLERQPGHGDRHPHAVRRRRRVERAGRGGDRRRLGARRRGPGVPQQGGRAAGGDPWSASDDRRSTGRRHRDLRLDDRSAAAPVERCAGGVRRPAEPQVDRCATSIAPDEALQIASNSVAQRTPVDDPAIRNRNPRTPNTSVSTTAISSSHGNVVTARSAPGSWRRSLAVSVVWRRRLNWRVSMIAGIRVPSAGGGSTVTVSMTTLSAAGSLEISRPISVTNSVACLLTVDRRHHASSGAPTAMISITAPMTVHAERALPSSPASPVRYESPPTMNATRATPSVITMTRRARPVTSRVIWRASASTSATGRVCQATAHT